MTKKIYLIIIACLFCKLIAAQAPAEIVPLSVNETSPCIPDAERQMVETRLQNNRAQLIAQHILQPVTANKLTHPLFRWPLTPKSTLTDNSYYVISNFVDLDSINPGSLKDYNCGARTYDISGYNHSGTDIALWPFGWYKMEHKSVKIVAAAPGIILDKHDGEFDHQCAMNNNPANYVIIQHADGSTAWYWHMKTNSVTTKAIGASVIEGELIGYVGSSGSSTGPHLHFEVHDATNKVIEPSFGPCNYTTPSTWWKIQKPYNERNINRLLVSRTAVNMPSCSTETFDESQKVCAVYLPPYNLSPYFYVFYRDFVMGDTAFFKVIRPDGVVWQSWNYVATSTYTAAYTYWSFYYFPNIGGTWTFEATYHNKVYTQPFYSYTEPPAITVTGGTTLCTGDSIQLTSSSDYGNTWSNGAVTQTIYVKTPGSYYVIANNPCGIDTSATIAISDGCTPPITGLSATNITNTGAKLNWNTLTCAKGYQVQYRKTGTTTWTSSTINSNTGNKTISGLIAGTGYYWRVRTKCATTPSVVWSPYSVIKNFTTTGPRLALTVDENAIQLFPNPTTGELNLVLNNLSGKYQLQITNALGQLIFEKNIFNDVDEYLTNIDLKNYPDGIYSVVLKSDEEFFVRKLIKHK
ncbi:MAG: peptidoglycan DD-metalloendopeptidase family protein [Bacteroidia bacterium]